MAAKDSVALKTKHSSSSIDKKSAHLTEGSNLTPLFDRKDHLKEPDASYNETSSSEESDYNQASVIFSLDELQTSLTGLRASVSPDVAAIEQHKNSAGLLFPSLIQDEDEKISVSSKEEQEDSDQNDEFVSSSTSSPVGDVLKSSDETNEVVKCSAEKAYAANTEVQPDDSLLCHIDNSVENIQSSVISEHSSVVDVTNDYLKNNKMASIDTLYVDTPPQVETPQVETPHVEPSSNDATITQSSPVDTPTAISNRSLSGTDLLGDTELSNSVCSDDIAVHHERPTDSISKSGSTVSKTLSEKLKPTQNTFESPGLLYAHPVKKSSKKITEPLEPAEAATEALQTEEKLLTAQKESRHVRAKADKRGELFIDQTHLPSFNYKNPTGIPLFYPPDRGSTSADEILLDDSVLKDIEKNAKKIAENLDYMLDNLRYSLHAMATCTKLSVSLHKEAIDDMHVTVDDSIKMMYAFLAKFEELNSNMKPIEALAAQIKDVSESLKILEKAIR